MKSTQLYLLPLIDYTTYQRGLRDWAHCTFGRYSDILSKGGIFCDFPFAVLHIESLMKMNFLLVDKIYSRCYPFRVGPFSEKKGKKKKKKKQFRQSYLPLKVFPFLVSRNAKKGA